MVSDPSLLEHPVSPDFDGLRLCLRREGRPGRVHVVELYQDGAIKEAIAGRFGIGADLNRADPNYSLRREFAMQRFLGYDLVRLHAPESEFRVDVNLDGAAPGDLQTTIQGYKLNEHAGPIHSWEHLERYPWPDAARIDLRAFEWAERHMPPGMKGYDLAMQVFEATTWLMGYESLFLNLCEDPDLVRALVDRVGACALDYVRLLCQFDCIGVIWGTDDLGHRTSTMVAPEWLREAILPWHRRAAAIAHEHGKLYFLHSCGRMYGLMDDFIDDVGIDAKHSFEDTILPVTDFYDQWGGRVGTLGGIDLDFLCQADEAAVRRRVRLTLDHCMPRGGYALGSGNSIASYVPVDNYLAMLDEARRYSL